MIKVITFDFDGVIVDSNHLKREAWFKLFPKKEKVSDALINNVLNRNLATRFEALRAIFTELGRSNGKIAGLVGEYAERYNGIVQGGIIELGLMPGVKEALVDLARHCALYLNSATPSDALSETVENLDLDRFFKGVFSVPPSKVSNLKKIMEIEGVKKREVVFVGDGESDYEAARACGISFVGIKNNFNNWDNTRFPLVLNIRTINEAIKCL